MPLYRNTNPLGWVDIWEIGRGGDAPSYVCHEPAECHDGHEHHEVNDPTEKGEGPVGPGEEFEAPKEIGDQLVDQGNAELVKPKAPPRKKTAKKTAAKKTTAPPPAASDDENPEA